MAVQWIMSESLKPLLWRGQTCRNYHISYLFGVRVKQIALNLICKTCLCLHMGKNDKGAKW